jgi:hypothetical protein
VIFITRRGPGVSAHPTTEFRLPQPVSLKTAKTCQNGQKRANQARQF